MYFAEFYNVMGFVQNVKGPPFAVLPFVSKFGRGKGRISTCIPPDSPPQAKILVV